jgi:magnesium transporter
MHRESVIHPPGTSPGTIVEAVDAPDIPTAIVLATYNEGTYDERVVTGIDDVPETPEPGMKRWLRVVGHDPALLREIGERFGVHPLVLEDIMDPGQRPKLEDYERYLFVILDVVRLRDEGKAEDEQVSLLVFPELLISIHEWESDLFRLVEERLRSGSGKIRKMSVDYLAYALVDAAVDHYFPELERLGEWIENIEVELLEDAQQSALADLYSIKRDLLALRRATWPIREIVAALSRSDSNLVHEDTKVWLRDVYDHAVQIIDIVETHREMTTGLVDLYMSSVSNRMNQVMKVLTIIATIFIPLTFVVGIYGMNFDTGAGRLNMPELGWAYGYPAVMLVMAVIAGVMLLWFKRRGWL